MIVILMMAPQGSLASLKGTGREVGQKGQVGLEVGVGFLAPTLPERKEEVSTAEMIQY